MELHFPKLLEKSGSMMYETVCNYALTTGVLRDPVAFEHFLTHPPSSSGGGGGGIDALSLGSSPLSSYGISRCAVLGERLRSLDLSFCAQLGRGAMSEILKGCGRIGLLAIRGCVQLDDAVLSSIGHHLARELHHLDAALLPSVGSEGVRAIAQCSHLRFLDVSGCERVGLAQGLDCVISNCRTLEALNVGDTPAIDGARLLNSLFVHRSRSLLQLGMAGKGVSDEASAEWGRSVLRVLRGLVLDRCGLGRNTWRRIARSCPALESLSLAGAEIPPPAFEEVVRINPRLKALNLGGCFRAEPPASYPLTPMLRLTALEFLNLAGASLADDVYLDVLRQLTGIQVLEVETEAQVDYISSRVSLKLLPSVFSSASREMFLEFRKPIIAGFPSIL